ncbi:MAG: hypothetical protein H7840_17065 [Alphaproteobacteria bacterium]
MPMRDRVRALFRRRHLYQATFNTPEGRVVLADLFRFCRVSAPVVVPGDPIMTGYNDGLRRVALRIAGLVNMTDEDIMRLTTQPEELIDE